jgi:hypothetical protein
MIHEPSPPSASNLVSHLRKCQKMPPELKIDALKARSCQPAVDALTPAQESIGLMFRSSAQAPKVPPTVLSPSLFRSTLIQGVIRDNYPLTFGEGLGMRQVFTFLNSSLKLPSHQAMRHDLYKLYDILFQRVQRLLKVSPNVLV